MFLFAVAMTSLAFGQRVEKGETQLNAGFGFNSGGFGLPVYAGVDYGIHNDVTLGAVASYVSYKVIDTRATWMSVGVNVNYHFNTLLNIPNNWDVYAGGTLAYNQFSEILSGVGFWGQLGARYYFTNRFGINLEFGGGDITTGGKIGISYKF
ncbi:Uncharacterised protein [Capnocytophaga canimorsus]|nr:conserved hypothetical protein [Capnocytophaga canimorsus]VEJ20265.1 Uncharacterised protein [Capnocytophaga canimorsus]